MIKTILADSTKYLQNLNQAYKFDLIVTSPPYGIGLEYEKKSTWTEYADFIEKWCQWIPNLLTERGSFWINTSNLYNLPLSYLYWDYLQMTSLKFCQEIIWEFPSGGAATNRFSKRHEIWQWWTKSFDYKFKLDDIRSPTIFADDKRNNPNGKNPGTVWYYQQCRATEKKSEHPCQFPIAPIQRIIEACSDKEDWILDPFCGSGTVGVVAKVLNRNFIGIDNCKKYCDIAEKRINEASFLDFDE